MAVESRGKNGERNSREITDSWEGAKQQRNKYKTSPLEHMSINIRPVAEIRLFAERLHRDVVELL